jgi:hypothetical protein
MKNKEQVTIFCFEYPPMLKGKLLHTTSGLYHLESDTIYIFLFSPFNWSPEGLIDTLIHEDCERAIQRIFWDDYVKASGWTHLFIKIAEKVNEMQFDSKPKKVSNVYKFLL